MLAVLPHPTFSFPNKTQVLPYSCPPAKDMPLNSAGVYTSSYTQVKGLLLSRQEKQLLGQVQREREKRQHPACSLLTPDPHRGQYHGDWVVPGRYLWVSLGNEDEETRSWQETNMISMLCWNSYK